MNRLKRYKWHLVGFLFIPPILLLALLRPANPAACATGVVSYFRGFHDLEGTSPVPEFTTGFVAEIAMDGTEALPHLLQALSEAENHIHMEVMYFLDDAAGRQVANALIAAARRDVEVRLMFDWDLSGSTDKTGLISIAGQKNADANVQQLVAEMQAAGVQVLNSYPIDRKVDANSEQNLLLEQMTLRDHSCLSANHRDHRKIVVIDGDNALFGGMNIADHYLYEEPFDPAAPGDEWHDFQVQLTGTIVTDLQNAFRQRWLISGGDTFSQTNPIYFPDFGQTEQAQLMRILLQAPGTHEISTTYYEVIENAQEEIWIQGPFIHHDPLFDALADAVARNVRVVLIVPGVYHDSPLTRMLMVARYQKLIDFGIELYEYDNRMLHDKVMIVDRHTTIFGSFNLNPRSFFHDLEVAIQIEDAGISERLHQELFETDITNATLVTEPPVQPWYWWLLTPAKPFS